MSIIEGKAGIITGAAGGVGRPPATPAPITIN